MQHISGNDRSADSEGMQKELPALLVSGGSCSSLCRSHSRDAAVREQQRVPATPPQRGYGPLQEHVVVAGNELKLRCMRP